MKIHSPPRVCSLSLSSPLPRTRESTKAGNKLKAKSTMKWMEDLCVCSSIHVRMRKGGLCVCVCVIDGRWSWVILVGVMDDNITCKKCGFESHTRERFL